MHISGQISSSSWVKRKKRFYQEYIPFSTSNSGSAKGFEIHLKITKITSPVKATAPAFKEKAYTSPKTQMETPIDPAVACEQWKKHQQQKDDTCNHADSTAIAGIRHFCFIRRRVSIKDCRTLWNSYNWRCRHAKATVICKVKSKNWTAGGP